MRSNVRGQVETSTRHTGATFMELDIEFLPGMLARGEAKAASGFVSFFIGDKEHKWTNVTLVVLARTLLIASVVPFDSPEYPKAGAIIIDFPNSLAVSEPIDFDLTNRLASLLFNVNSLLIGLGPEFKLESFASEKYYKGTFKCENLLLSKGTFEVTL